METEKQSSVLANTLSGEVENLRNICKAKLFVMGLEVYTIT